MEHNSKIRFKEGQPQLNASEVISKLKRELKFYYQYKDKSKKNLKLELNKKIEQLIQKKENNDDAPKNLINEIIKIKSELYQFKDKSLLKKIHRDSKKDIDLLIKLENDNRCFTAIKSLLEIQKEVGNFDEGYNLDFNESKIMKKFDFIENKFTTVRALRKYNHKILKDVILKIKSLKAMVSNLTNGENIERFLQSIDVLKTKMVRLSESKVINNSKRNGTQDYDNNLKKNKGSDNLKSNKFRNNKNRETIDERKNLKIFEIVINGNKQETSVKDGLEEKNVKDLMNNNIMNNNSISSPFKRFLESKIEQVIYDIINEIKQNDNYEEDIIPKNREIKRIVLEKNDLLKEVNKRLKLKIPLKDFNIFLNDISDNNEIYEKELSGLDFLNDDEGDDLLLVDGNYIIYYY